MTAIDECPPFDACTEATLLVEALVAAIVNSRIYELDHPRVVGSIAEVHAAVRRLAAGTARATIRLGTYDGMIVFDKKPLLGASISVKRLVDRITHFGAGGMEFDAAVTTEQLLTFFVALIDRTAPERDYDACNQRLAREGCRGARLLPPYADGIESGFGDPVQLELSFHQAVIDLLQTITVSVCRGGRIDFGPVQSQAEEVLRRLEGRRDLHLGLAREDQYDAFTFGHSLRVAILSMSFARTLTDDRDLLVRIGTAALLHDVGKALIPFEILHSTKPLSDEERREMNRHAELGAECLLDHHDSDPLAIAAAFGHHRSPDGSGYPSTSHKHPVSLVTSIVKICDIFEALTAARPYKQPMSPIRAYRVMIAMGEKLDQALLRRFIETNGIYPIGQLVALADGSVAVVRAQTGDMLRPKVALLDESGRRDLLERDEELLDLSDIQCCAARQILAELTPAEADERLLAGAKAGPAAACAADPNPVSGAPGAPADGARKP